MDHNFSNCNEINARADTWLWYADRYLILDGHTMTMTQLVKYIVFFLSSSASIPRAPSAHLRVGISLGLLILPSPVLDENALLPFLPGFTPPKHSRRVTISREARR
jgi:hypothetical protein